MPDAINEILTNELKQLVGNPAWKIIDVRPVDAYNGWCLNGEERGGHIPGAKSLPLKWLKYIDWIEIVIHKNILPDDNIVIYGYSTSDAEKVAERFLNAGFNKIKVYKDFINEWISDTRLPLEHLKRYQNLVPASWVHEHVSGKSSSFSNKNLVIVHAHYRNRDAYLSGHIPGAIDMDTLSVEAPETWNRRPFHELKDSFEKHGISKDSLVIVYGKFMSPTNTDDFPGSAAGDIGAMRIAFIMKYAGIENVRVLNGGFQSWIDEGYDISFTDEPKIQVSEFGLTKPANLQLAIDTPEAKDYLASSEAELVCVRSWAEYIGEVSGYNYIEQKGRIPGAIFADCGSDAYHMENYRNPDHTTREYHEIEEIWKQNGITPEKKLAFYCGTGWRGSEAWFNAWLMGWPNVSVYDGGWFEWSANSENPIETGIPGSLNVFK